MVDSSSQVFLLKTTDRQTGVTALVNRIGLVDYSEAQVAIKANFNSADPFPASTHIDTLRALVQSIKGTNPSSITLAERSGMGNTKEVLEQMGVLALANELDFKTIVLDDVDKDDWIRYEKAGMHWLRGFYLGNIFHDADKIVQTCCLKTHRYGGHFTLSMKNSVGMVAKKVPGGLYDYMWELHGSPYQRQMIAEINANYNLDFVVMDGIKAFITGGPERGKVVEPNLLLASRDRVAIDAVGASVLKLYGAKGKVGTDAVFEQDQIKRAVELGFGVHSPDEIQLTPLNEEAKEDTQRIKSVLKTEVAMH